MRVLLDTHTLVWAFDNPAKLSKLATSSLLDPTNERFVSIATAWELAIKVSLKKLNLSLQYGVWIERALNDLNAALTTITLDHLDTMLSLPHHHRDPFDRLIIAQALVEGMPIVSVDPAFDSYPIQRLW